MSGTNRKKTAEDGTGNDEAANGKQSRVTCPLFPASHCGLPGPLDNSPTQPAYCTLCAVDFLKQMIGIFPPNLESQQAGARRCGDAGPRRRSALDALAFRLSAPWSRGSHTRMNLFDTGEVSFSGHQIVFSAGLFSVQRRSDARLVFEVLFRRFETFEVHLDKLSNFLIQWAV